MTSPISRRLAVKHLGGAVVAATSPLLVYPKFANALPGVQLPLSLGNAVNELVHASFAQKLATGVAANVLSALLLDILHRWGRSMRNGPIPPHPSLDQHHRQAVSQLEGDGYRTRVVYRGDFAVDRDATLHRHFGRGYIVTEANNPRGEYQALSSNGHHQRLCSNPLRPADLVSLNLLTSALRERGSPDQVMAWSAPLHEHHKPRYDQSMLNHDDKGAAYLTATEGTVSWRNRGFGGPHPQVQAQVHDRGRNLQWRFEFSSDGGNRWSYRSQA